MANPMKVVKAAKRLVVGSNKDIKTNKSINKKLEKTLGTKTISQGKAKANTRNAKVKDSMNPIARGKNKNFAKDANKKTVPSASTSRRASIKEASFYNRMEKHPLARNAGESSAEGKYRLNRGKSIPKKRGK
jgi:hypothetical protein